jgi:hypothetical protein
MKYIIQYKWHDTNEYKYMPNNFFRMEEGHFNWTTTRNIKYAAVINLGLARHIIKSSKNYYSSIHDWKIIPYEKTI